MRMNELEIGNYYKCKWDSGDDSWGIIKYDSLHKGVYHDNYKHKNYVYLGWNKRIEFSNAGGGERNEWNLCTEEEKTLFDKQFQEQYGNKKEKSSKYEPLIFN